jgi:hypothetical protein
MWKEAVVAKFKVLSGNLPGETEEYHEKLQPECPVCGSRFEPQTSQTRRKSVSHSVARPV